MKLKLHKVKTNLVVFLYVEERSEMKGEVTIVKQSDTRNKARLKNGKGLDEDTILSVYVKNKTELGC